MFYDESNAFVAIEDLDTGAIKHMAIEEPDGILVVEGGVGFNPKCSIAKYDNKTEYFKAIKNVDWIINALNEYFPDVYEDFAKTNFPDEPIIVPVTLVNVIDAQSEIERDYFAVNMETGVIKEIDVNYVSVWDGDEIESDANIDVSTGKIDNIKMVEISEDYECCEKEFIRYGSGEETDVVIFKGQYYAFDKLPKLSSKFSKSENTEEIEELMFSISEQQELIVFDQGFYIEVYGNPNGKYSEISDGGSLFLFTDQGILYGELLDICSYLGCPKDDTLSIRIIPSEDSNYFDEKLMCQNVSSLLKEKGSRYRRI